MKIPNINNLEFKDVVYRKVDGVNAIFVICIDKKSNGRGTEEKYYWGLSIAQDDAKAIEKIMRTGAKWNGFSPDGDILL